MLSGPAEACDVLHELFAIRLTDRHALEARLGALWTEA
jgi:hypothetical protein